MFCIYMVLCALLTTLFVKHALVANHITLRRVWLIVSLGVLFCDYCISCNYHLIFAIKVK
ncbi:hypothetical protein CG392_05465 [Gardnerella vaginalis]|nr:hypothetical protein CG392_05465 [Gardnerella vaginalis]RIY21531.1 hypothetical protein CJI53_05385 [Bifidobacteriaceae bacterium VN002]